MFQRSHLPEMTGSTGLRPWSVAAAVACLLSSAVVQAQEADLPLFLTLSQTITRDSNVLRNDADKRSDTISTTAARFGLNKAYGRQNYRLDATISRNKYSQNDRFNYNGVVTSGEFVSDIGSNVRVNANFAASEVLPKFEDRSDQDSRLQANIQTTRRVAIDMRYGLYGRMSVNAGFNRTELEYKVTDNENKDSDSWVLGFRYLPNDLMSYGVNYTHTDTELPKRFVFGTAGEQVNRRNLSLVTAWRVTGFSLLNASIGFTQERYERDANRDFDGITGSASWTFTPAGKVSYRVSWLRDTNNEGGFSLGSSTSTFVSSERLTDQYSASATWQATAKVSATAQLTHATYKEGRAIEGGNAAIDLSLGDGRLNALSIGVAYQPLRSVNLSCDWQKYDRTASTFFPNPYSGDAVGCTAGFTLD